MKAFRIILIVFVAMLILAGCQTEAAQTKTEAEKTSTEPQTLTETEVSASEVQISARGKTYTLAEIQEGILRVVNTEFYYSSANSLHLNREIILNKTLEYDLIFVEDHYIPYVLLIFNNMDHPLSTEEKPKFFFEIAFTDWGMEEQLFGHGTCSQDLLEFEMQYESRTYLGNYSFCIREITPPQHEVMSDEWKRATEAEIRMYMDENDFHNDKEKDLQPGKYMIYVQGFGKGDQDSRIFFEHESGRIYEGFYYFVHTNDGEGPADLNHVSSEVYDLYGMSAEYYEKVKLNAALQMEYSVAPSIKS